MKKFLLSLILALMAITNTWAYDINQDGIYYNLDSSAQTAQVTSGPQMKKYSGNIIIPASITYDGATYSVTEIGNFAFTECHNLSSVEIPNSVTKIEVDAFRNCFGLTSIEIPNSVTEIGEAAFQG